MSKFFFDHVHIDASVKGGDLHIRLSGDVSGHYVFRSGRARIHEGIALLTAHFCAVPFRIQAKRCTVTPRLENARYERAVDVFFNNMSTYVSLYSDYPCEIHKAPVTPGDASIVQNALATCSFGMPNRAAVAGSLGKESLLMYHVLRRHDVPTDVYAVNMDHEFQTAKLHCPPKLTRHPCFGPSGWRDVFNMTSPWRIFTMAVVADDVDTLFLGDEFETNQLFRLGREYFFADDFDQSVYLSGLLNWAIAADTRTRFSSLVANMCELQIQGVLGIAEPDWVHKQISCWKDTTWCGNCSKCRRFSIMFEALYDNTILPPVSLGSLENMDAVKMWCYCDPLANNSRYVTSPFFLPGRLSLHVLRELVLKKRGEYAYVPDHDTLGSMLSYEKFPLLDNAFAPYLVKRIGEFYESLQEKTT